MRAILTADKRHVIIKGRTWSDTFPVNRLDDWLAFYERMAKKPGREKHYAPTVAALTRVRSRLLESGEG